jgi:hypothetical protein
MKLAGQDPHASAKRAIAEETREQRYWQLPVPDDGAHEAGSAAVPSASFHTP